MSFRYLIRKRRSGFLLSFLHSVRIGRTCSKRLDALKDGHDKNGPGAEFVMCSRAQRHYTVHEWRYQEPASLPAQADRHLFTIDRINAESQSFQDFRQ